MWIDKKNQTRKIILHLHPLRNPITSISYDSFIHNAKDESYTCMCSTYAHPDRESVYDY